MAAELTESPLFSDLDFLAVPMSALLHRRTALTDLFVRLPTERMVKVAHKGGVLDVERISRMSDKNVQQLYVHRHEFSGVVTDLVRGASALGGHGKIPQDLKIAKYFNIAESVYLELLQLPISDESLGRAVRLSQEISTSMQEKPDFAKLVQTVVGMGDEFAKHSVGAVVMANLLCVQLDWGNARLVQPVTMGAFFHDVGLKEIPRELWFKNRLEMTHEEGQIWETHPMIGMQMLSTLNIITPDVLRIVQEHHELPSGTGFPAKLRLDRIFPMAKVVAFGNVLAHDLFESDGQPFSLELMAQKIDHVYSVMFGADLSRAARRIFKKDEK